MGYEVWKHLDLVVGYSKATCYGDDVTIGSSAVFTPADQLSGIGLGLRLKAPLGERFAVSSTTTIAAMAHGIYRVGQSGTPADVVTLEFPLEERLAIGYRLGQHTSLGLYYSYMYSTESIGMHSVGLTFGIAL